MKKYILLVVYTLTYLFIYSQSAPGFISSNYCGVSNVNFDPAIAATPIHVDISLGSTYCTGSNNTLGVNYPNLFSGHPDREFYSSDVLGNSFFSSNIITVRGNSNHFFYKNSETLGPLSFMFGFGKHRKNALAFTYHYNTVKNISTNDINLVELFSPTGLGSFNSPVQGTSSFALKSLSWIDVGVTYSRVLFETDEHLFKMGVTPKFLMGTGSENINSNQLSYSASASGGTASGAINYFTTPGFMVSNNGINFGNGLQGTGFAGDVGFVYEWRPKIASYYYEMDGDTQRIKNDRDVYTLKVGFSATDLGFLSLNSSNESGQYTLNSYPITDNSISQITNAKDVISNLNGQNYITSSNGPVTYLMPMRFNLFLDYNIAKGFGLNLTTRIAPALPSLQYYVHHVTDVIFTPRFDSKWFGFYIPFSSDINNNIALGVAARLGPFFVGFDNLLVFMNKGAFKAGAYAGVKIPIPFHLPKDRDKDKVSDAMDLCPTIPGSWATHGCPDADFDGVPDFEDSCINEPGPARTHGCPDRDNDGVIDKMDRCPDDSGSVALRGCPDRDGDGVADIDDSCPDIKGLISAHGCPDEDGDGVPDYLDACPHVKGDPKHHGCPDTDGDGVYDDQDLCPTVQGPKENNGCPWEDSDHDGIYDNEDSCPHEFGIAKYHGCPDPIKHQINDLDVAFDTIYFASGSSVVTQFSSSKLDKLISQRLSMDPNHGLRVVGYTDSIETDADGYDILSKDRALHVRGYLIDHGIAADRIDYDGWGIENPAGDNKVGSGRSKNRRVIIYVNIATH